MAYATAHWTLFAQPGWSLLPCPAYNSSSSNCMLPGGGNYAALTSPDGTRTNADEKKDFTMVLETLTHGASMCFRNDPHGDWPVATNQVREKRTHILDLVNCCCGSETTKEKSPESIHRDTPETEQKNHQELQRSCTHALLCADGVLQAGCAEGSDIARSMEELRGLGL